MVLVTGASSGIGAATARAYGREGARAAITYRNNPDKAEKVAADIEALGGQAHVVRLDLEDLPTIDHAAATVIERWGGIDALAAATPSRRLSNSDDVAKIIVFLGSGANGNLTGEVIRDGSSAARAPHLGG